MVAADNTKPVQDAQDQKKTGTQPSTYEHAESTATQRILEENRGAATNNNDSTPGAKKPGDSGASGVHDGSDTGTPGPETAVDQMLREVETAMRTASESVSAVSKMLAAGISPELAAKFGSPEMFDSAEEGGETGRADALVNDAKAEESKTKVEKTEPGESGESSVVGDALNNFGSWAADTFNKYVAEPVTEAMSDISTAFDDAVQWLGQSDTFVPVKGPIADINNGTDEYRAAQNQAARTNRFDLNGATDRSGEQLRLPENAVEAGTVEIGGNKVSVYKTPEGETFLKNGDKVIGQQKADGSYELGLKDGSTLDFKLSEGKDGYKVDHLERTKDGKLQQKIADGVFYNYNYDAQGNRTSVDAAADLKGPLTPEQMDRIKKELGDSGAAALRVTDENGKTKRLLLQAHDKDTTSLTDIDAKRAQIFHDGKEYYLNEKDQLALVGGDNNPDSKEEKTDQPTDQPDQPETEEDKSRREEVEKLREAQLKALEDLARRLRERAQGDSDAAVDGVKIHKDPEDPKADVTVTREDPSTGEPVTTTTIPEGEDKPISITNSNGEKIEIRDGNVDVKSKDDDLLFDFNKETGLRTDDALVDRDGLTDLDSGATLDSSGDLFDPNGNYISMDNDPFFGTDRGEFREIKEATTTARIATAQLTRLSDSVTVSMSQGDPQAALRVGTAALAYGNGALASVGNDLFAQIPISHALSQVKTLVAEAGSASGGNSTSAGRDRLRLVS